MNEPDHRPRGAMSVNDFAVWAGIGRTSAWKEIREGRLRAVKVTVDQGLTSRAIFIAIGPRLNHRVMSAFRVYENELIADDNRDTNRVPFQAFTLETVIDALGDAGAADLAQQLWARYCDFERVYHLALQEFIDAPSAPPQPAIPSKKPASLNGPSSFQKKSNSNATPAPRSKKRTASRSRTKSKVTA